MSNFIINKTIETEIEKDIEKDTSNLVNNNLKGIFSFLNDSDVEDDVTEEVKDIDSLKIINNEYTTSRICDETETNIVDITPLKKNTKTYKEEKIKLLGETQRLIRETPIQSFKYKPKQFKTISQLREVIQKSREIDNTQIINNKENIIKSVNDVLSEDINNDEPLPLIQRFNISEEIKRKLTSKPKIDNSNDSALKAINILQKKYNKTDGILYLYNESKNKEVNKKKEELLMNLKKSMNNPVCINEAGVTDFNILIKNVDPKTGEPLFEHKVISSKKDHVKLPKGIDPNIARLIIDRLTEEELVKWNLMSPNEKNAFLKQMMMTDSDTKRRMLREKRMKDHTIISKIKKTDKKTDNGLSDDDFEWNVDQEDDDNSDCESEFTNNEDEEDDENEEEEEFFTIKNKQNKKLKVGIIEDDDDDDDLEKKENNINDLGGREFPPFIDDASKNATFNTSDVFPDVSFDKDVTIVMSPTKGERSLRHYEISPKIEISKELHNVVLPQEVITLIDNLKEKYGLINHLVCGDSTVLLLPTMKTTTTCIEVLFKEQILTKGCIYQESFKDFDNMVREENPRMLAEWQDNFNYLVSIKKDEYCNFAMNSFSNINKPSITNNITENEKMLKINMDDTLIIKPTMEMNATEIMPDTGVMNEDDSSNSTILLNSEYNTSNPSTSFNSTCDNNVHAQIFQFENTKKKEIPEALSIAQKVFANLNSLISDSEECEETEEVGEISLKKEVAKVANNVDMDDSDIDNVDLDFSDVDLDTSDVNNKENEESNSDEYGEYIDENDEEELLRKNVKNGSKFIPTDYIDEEAELSGSDAEEYGPDEDELDMDTYEDEEGDKDKLPSKGKLRRQLERIHQKMEIDKDAHDIRYLKEMYLEDGDLNIEDEGPRKKRFDWDNMNDSETFVREYMPSDGEDDEEYEDIPIVNVDPEDEEKKNNVDEAAPLFERYDKFLIGAMSKEVVDVQKNDQGTVRPAWSTNIAPVTVAKKLSVKKFGSMMNKSIRSFETSKADIVIKASMNDFDLKTRMSVMYSSTSRTPQVPLKRGSTILSDESLKKQRYDD